MWVFAGPLSKQACASKDLDDVDPGYQDENFTIADASPQRDAYIPGKS